MNSRSFGMLYVELSNKNKATLEYIREQAARIRTLRDTPEANELSRLVKEKLDYFDDLQNTLDRIKKSFEEAENKAVNSADKALKQTLTKFNKAEQRTSELFKKLGK